jgi:phage replication O-like protein O
MAPSPQLEDGYVQIAREIGEALCRVNLSPYESRVLWFIFLKTYGFKKKMDWIALSQFAKSLRLDRRLVHRALRSLSSKKMTVIGRDDKNRPTYGFQKDYSQWKVSSKKMTVICGDDGLSSPEIPTKETLTKENTLRRPDDPEFERAWTLYPKRAGGDPKKKAWSAWRARVREGVEPEEMTAGVERYATYIRAVGSEGTQYVKQAATFLGPDEHWKEPWNIPAARNGNGRPNSGGRNMEGFAP